MEKALGYYVDGAAGKSRSIRCLAYAVGVLADLQDMPHGYKFREECMEKLTSVYLPPVGFDADSEYYVDVDPVAFDEIRKGVMAAP